MVKSELVQKLCNSYPNILRADIEKILDIIFLETIEALAKFRGGRIGCKYVESFILLFETI